MTERRRSWSPTRVSAHRRSQKPYGGSATARKSSLLATKHYRFCETPTCSVVYFAPEGVRLERDDVCVAVPQKDNGPGVPLCYCFGYTRARLVGEGEGAIAFVGGEVKARRCACDVKNPSGRCCLGDLRRFLRARGVPPAGTGPMTQRRRA